MTDLERDLTDLLRVKAEATTVTLPPLDAIVAEGKVAAARHHRHVGFVAAAAVAAVVAAIAIPVGVLHATRSAPGPLGPAKHSTDIARARRIIATGTVAGMAVSPSSNGPIAVLWRKGLAAEAWELIDGLHVQEGLVPGDDPTNTTITGAGHGFLLTDSNLARGGYSLDPGGRVTPLRQASSLAVSAGDVLVSSQLGTELVDPSTGRWTQAHGRHRLLGDGGVVAGATAWGETVVGQDGSSGNVQANPHYAVEWRNGAGSWHTSALPARADALDQLGDLAVTGGQPSDPHLAVMVEGSHRIAADASTGTELHPVKALDVSQDGARTWTSIPASALPLSWVARIAATNGPLFHGTLFISGYGKGGAGWQLYRSTDSSWTHFARVEGVGDVQSLQPVGRHRMLAIVGTGTSARFEGITDHGIVHPGQWMTKIAALAGPSASASPSGPPTTIAQLRQGAVPATLAYLHGGALHVGTLSIPTKANRLETAAGTVLVGRWKLPGVLRWWVLRNDTLVAAPWAGTGDLWLSPDGKVVAVLTWPHDRYAEISAYAARTGRPLGSTRIDVRPGLGGGGRPVELQSVDDRHQVFFLSDVPKTGYYMWQVPRSGGAGSAPVRVGALSDLPAGSPGVQFGPRGPITGKGEGTVDAHGHLGGSTGLPTAALDSTTVWSPDLDLLAYTTAQDADTELYDLATNTIIGLGLPEHVSRTRVRVSHIQVQGFAGDHAVLLTARDDRADTRLLTCPVSGASCRRVLDLGTHPGRWVFGGIPW